MPDPRPKVDYYFEGLEKPYTVDWNTATTKEREILFRLKEEYGEPSTSEPHVDIKNKFLPGITEAFLGKKGYEEAVEKSGGPPEYDPSFVSPGTARAATSMGHQIVGEEVGGTLTQGSASMLMNALPQGRLLRAAKPAIETGARLLGTFVGSAGGQAEAQDYQMNELGIAPDEQGAVEAGLWGASGEALGMLAGKAWNASAKGLVRSGVEVPDAKRAIARLDSIGVDPTMLQIVGPGFYRAVIEMLHRIPMSQGAVARAINKTNDQLSGAIKRRTQVYVNGELRFPEFRHAGREIKENVAGLSKMFKDRSKLNYGRFYAMLPKDFSIKSDNLRTFLEETVPRSNRPMVRRYTNKKTKTTYDDFLDEYVISRKNPVTGAVSTIVKDVPFEDIKTMRTHVGNLLSNKTLDPKFNKSDLKQMYAAMSEDIRAALPEGSPRRIAFDKATDEFMEGIDVIQTTLNRVHKKVTPEEAFSAIEQMVRTNNVTHMRNIKRSFVDDPVGWDVVRRTWMHDAIRLGGGEELTPMNFFNAWQKMTPDMKRMIAETPGLSAKANKEILQGIEDTALVAKNHWSPEGMANPLMTRSEIRNVSGKSQGLFSSLVGGGVIAGTAGAVTGSAFAALAGLAVALKGPQFLSNVLFDPKFTRWVVEGSKVKPGGIGGHIGKLAGLFGNASADDQEQIRSFLEVMEMLNEEAAMTSGDPIQALMVRGGGFNALGQ